MKHLIGLILVVTVLTACQQAKNEPIGGDVKVQKGENEVPAGWKVFEGSDFSVALPNDWQTLDLTSKTLSDSMDQLKIGGPGGAGIQAQVKALAASGIFKMFAVGPSNDPKFSNNVNVIVVDRPANITIQQVLDENVKQYKSMNAKVLDQGLLDGSDRAFAQSELPMETPSGKLTVRNYVVFLLGDKKLMTVTYSSSPKDADGVIKMATQSAETAKLK